MQADAAPWPEIVGILESDIVLTPLPVYTAAPLVLRPFSGSYYPLPSTTRISSLRLLADVLSAVLPLFPHQVGLSTDVSSVVCPISRRNVNSQLC